MRIQDCGLTIGPSAADDLAFVENRPAAQDGANHAPCHTRGLHTDSAGGDQQIRRPHGETGAQINQREVRIRANRECGLWWREA
jgi:hypothetical protein